MSKHTPGPWRTHGEHWVEDSRQVLLATCKWLVSFDETRANARLIAAAPELLAALQEQVMDCWARSGVGLPDHEKDCNHCRSARAAIEKATGGKP